MNSPVHAQVHRRGCRRGLAVKTKSSVLQGGRLALSVAKDEWLRLCDQITHVALRSKLDDFATE